MSPEGALHFVPRLNRLREKGLSALATDHNLRTAYLKNALDLTSTDADEHLHWQPLHKVRWLQHVQTGVVVVVVGGPQHFVDSIDSIRESAGFRNDEMKLLNFDRVAWLLRPPDVRPHLPHMYTVGELLTLSLPGAALMSEFASYARYLK